MYRDFKNFRQLSLENLNEITADENLDQILKGDI